MVRYLLGGVALGLLMSGVGFAQAAGGRRDCKESCSVDTFACVQNCNQKQGGYEACAQECQERGRACTQRCGQDNRY